MLLAAQASGIAGDLWKSTKENKYGLLNTASSAAGFLQTRSANRMVDLGTELDKQRLDIARLQGEVASSEQTLESTKQLNQVMAMQRAIAGVNGSNAGPIGNLSLGNYQADERARNLSLKFNADTIANQQRILALNATVQKASNYSNQFSETAKNLGGLFDAMDKLPDFTSTRKGVNVSAGSTRKIYWNT